ncbi:NAD-dependent dehydratase, partial [Streptomyces sp. EKR5.2]
RTDDAGPVLLRLGAHTGRGAVTREDVAAVLAELVDTPATAGLTLELIGGSTPVSVAVKSVAGN